MLLCMHKALGEKLDARRCTTYAAKKLISWIAIEDLSGKTPCKTLARHVTKNGAGFELDLLGKTLHTWPKSETNLNAGFSQPPRGERPGSGSLAELGSPLACGGSVPGWLSRAPWRVCLGTLPVK